MKNIHETKQRIFELGEKRKRGDNFDANVFLNAAPDMVEVIREQDELLRECLDGFNLIFEEEALTHEWDKQIDNTIEKLEAALGESEG